MAFGTFSFINYLKKKDPFWLQLEYMLIINHRIMNWSIDIVYSLGFFFVCLFYDV